MLYEKKVKINDLISRIKDVELLKKIFFLVEPELNKNGDRKYSYNNNGIFFDMNNLSDTIILQLEELISLISLDKQ